MKKTFNYVNDLGYHKQLVVEDVPENDKLFVMLFGHGELCGSDYMTRAEINEFLEHYGVEERV